MIYSVLKFYTDDATSASVPPLLERMEKCNPTNIFQVDEGGVNFYTATFSDAKPYQAVQDIAKLVTEFGEQIRELVRAGVSVDRHRRLSA